MKSVSVHQDFFKQIRKHTDAEIGRFFRALAAEVDGSEQPELPETLEMLKEMVIDQNNRFSQQQSGKRRAPNVPNEPKQPNEPNVPNEPTQPTVTYTVSVSDTEKDIRSCAEAAPRAVAARTDCIEGRTGCPAGHDGAQGVDGVSEPAAEPFAEAADKPSAAKGGNSALFEEFWQRYPKKRSKGDALKAWKALKPDKTLAAAIMDALSRLVRSPDWLKDGGQYVPYPATWLRAQGWLDEIADSGAGFQRQKQAVYVEYNRDTGETREHDKAGFDELFRVAGSYGFKIERVSGTRCETWTEGGGSL